MKIHAVEQRTPEWFRLRAGIPTASEFHSLVTPKWKVRTGEVVETYLAKKLAEKWRGDPLPGWSGSAMEQGTFLEPEAIPFFEIRTRCKIRPIGFITSDDGKIGCSPDGLFSDESGIEIKCPAPNTQVRYLLKGAIPDEYQAQIQGSLFVTGASHWTFFSYSREFPPLILEARPIPEAFEALRQALEAFCERLEAGYERLRELYGETPPCEATEILGF